MVAAVDHQQTTMILTSIWASMASWFTPTVLFCVLNVMVGTIFFTSNFKTHQKRQDQHHPSHDSADSPQLTRVPSLLQRVKSINFSLYRAEQLDPFHSITQYADPSAEKPEKVRQNADSGSVNGSSEVTVSHVTRTKSEPHGEAPVKIMKKSASEKRVVAKGEEEEEEDQEVDERRRPATVKERKWKWDETSSVHEDEAVDAKADDFINRFKQQLKLQRLDSILRYKEMLNRGVAR